VIQLQVACTLRTALAAGCLVIAYGALFPHAAPAQDTPWYPVPVDVWEPPLVSEAKRVPKDYVPLGGAQEPWRIRVFIPHIKDAYWLGVDYGLVAEARRQGVVLSIHEAGGYGHLDEQRKQLKEVRAEEVDGVIVAAISLDGLNDLVGSIDKLGIPVLDLINGISSPHIKARAAVSFRDMGYAAGLHLRKLAKKSAEPIQVAWFPGPEGAGWVAAGDAGFRAAIEGHDIEVLLTAHGDTGKSAQSELIEQALEQHAEVLDYIVGTAVTAEAAVGILRSSVLNERIGVLSYYYSPGVHRGIARGQIIAAPSDCPATQARIAIDVMVRILEKREHFRQVAPRIQLVDGTNIRDWDSSSSIAPRGFRPIFSVNK
jgi:protein TorT